MSSTKKKVLLTGATGFLGKTFITLYQDNFEIQPLNLRDASYENVDYSNFDCLVHCAALVHQMQGAPEQEYFEINAELTKRLATTAKQKGLAHFIYISTAHVFGDSGSLSDHSHSYSETSECYPKDAYGRSKLLAEKYLNDLHSDGFTVSIVRPPMVYGKGAKGNIVTLAKLIKKCAVIPLDYRKNRRSIVYVENLCGFIERIIERKKSGIFLPQDAKPVSIAELVTLIATALEKQIVLFALPGFALRLVFLIFPKLGSRLFGTLQLDSSASNTALEYTPRYSTLEGLKKMLS